MKFDCLYFSVSGRKI